jgi:hypothetical protein
MVVANAISIEKPMADAVASDDDGCMTITAIGPIATAPGLCQHRDQWGDPIPSRVPASSYLAEQPKSIPIHVVHDRDWRIGSTVHLERRRGRDLLAVAQLDDSAADLLDDGRDWHFSPSVSCHNVGSVQFDYSLLNEISITNNPATHGLKALRWSRNDAAPRGMPVLWYSTWENAAERMDSGAHRRSHHHVILDLDEGGRPLQRSAVVTPSPPAAKPTPTPLATTTHRRAAAPRVLWFGKELDEEMSAEVIEGLRELALGG